MASVAVVADACATHCAAVGPDNGQPGAAGGTTLQNCARHCTAALATRHECANAATGLYLHAGTASGLPGVIGHASHLKLAAPTTKAQQLEQPKQQRVALCYAEQRSIIALLR
jgi:hypothetical protein